MTETVRFFFDFVSPYAYMASTRLKGLQATHDVEIVYKPVPVLDLMKRVGNTPTSAECAPKRAYAGQDLGRWALAYGVPFAVNPHLRKADPRGLLNAAASAGRRGYGEAFALAVLRSAWAERVALDDDAALIRHLIDAGVPGAASIWGERGDFHGVVDANMEEAIEAGVFGVPSFIYRDRLFFGNDRLSFLEQALAS